MTNRPEFNELKKELLGLVGIMEALEIHNTKTLEAEFRRFSLIVGHRLPKSRKESVEIHK